MIVLTRPEIVGKLKAGRNSTGASQLIKMRNHHILIRWHIWALLEAC